MSAQLQETTKIDSATAEALVKRCKACAMTLGWKFPFFLPAVARIEFVATGRAPTAYVNLRGQIGFNPTFAASLKDVELQFVIAHELMHLLMLHHERRGHRDPLKFNIAGDLIINRTLKNVSDMAGAGSFQMPKEGIIADPSQSDMTAEQLYSEIPDPPQWLQDAYAAGAVPVAQGCGAEPDPNGKNASTPEEQAAARAEEDRLRREWQETAAQSQLSGRSAGDQAGNLLANLLDLPTPKVRWSDVLRGALNRAIAEAGRDDVSWQRRSRRSTLEIILPGGVTHRCKAAVVIDTSGSMSDEVLARCVAETVAIVNSCRVPVFLVSHDHVVQDAAWIMPGGKGVVAGSVKKRMKGRGGTSFDGAYERVAEEKTKFNVMVHLTDGEVGHWPNKPGNARRMVAALVGSSCRDSVPEGTRTIEIEI